MSLLGPYIILRKDLLLLIATFVADILLASFALVNALKFSTMSSDLQQIELDVADLTLFSFVALIDKLAEHRIYVSNLYNYLETYLINFILTVILGLFLY